VAYSRHLHSSRIADLRGFWPNAQARLRELYDVIVVVPKEPAIPCRSIRADRDGREKQAKNAGPSAPRKDEFRNFAQDCYIRRHFENTQCNGNP